MSKILVIGSSCVDIELIVDKMPECGETVSEKNYCYIPGGSATNSALMFRQFGFDTAICTCIAEDDGGVRLKKYYRKNGIDTRFISLAENMHTGLGVIIANEHRSNRYIFYGGANSGLSAKDVEDAMDFHPDAVFLQLSVPKDAVRMALDICERRHIPVYCYTGQGECYFPSYDYTCVELVFANEKTFADITGNTFEPSNYVINCVKLFEKTKAKNLMIRLKNGNLLLYYRRFHYVETPLCEVTPRDMATSFDTMAATAAYALSDGLSIRESAKFALLIEEMTMTGTGSSASCPNIANMEKFIRDHDIKDLQ